MSHAPRSVKELPFACFSSLNKGWRTAKTGSEHVVDPMTDLRATHMVCPLRAEGAELALCGTIAAVCVVYMGDRHSSV